VKANITMLYDRLLVRVIGEDNRTDSGLFIPDMALENTPYRRAEVVEVGHGRITQNGDTVPLSVKVGDVVVFFRTGTNGEQLVYPAPDGKDLMIIREPHVAMILRDLPQDTGLVNQDGKELLVTS
jgi:chaperonin GroES